MTINYYFNSEQYCLVEANEWQFGSIQEALNHAKELKEYVNALTPFEEGTQVDFRHPLYELVRVDFDEEF
jgi:hypothetical protein